MISGQTDSGIRYAVKRSGSAVGYCALSIKCGTRDEVGQKGGIAHFTEHTIFKGTEKKSSSVINSYIDRLGGELNAYTTKEEIVLHATVLKEDLWKAASLLFEIATRATFPENEITTEKSVVIDEINSYKDAPSEEIYDKFEEMLFEGHPLARPILGTAASVRKITREDLLEFVKEKFVPQNMAFTVVADTDEKRLAAQVGLLSDKFFGKLQDKTSCMLERAVPDNSKIINGLTAQIVQGKIFEKTVNKRNHQANCVIGAVAPSLYEERERIATSLMCNILGGPATNSTLNAILREKNGWVYGVECSYTQYADTGIVAICLGCERDNLEKCLKAIDKEILKMQDGIISERKLKAAKKQFLGQLAISSDNGETQCLSMGKSLLAYGKVASDEINRKKIEDVTAEEIREAAQRVFSKEKLSRLIFI